MKRLQNLLFGFSGRIGRGQFWLGILCLLIATIALSAVAIALGFSQSVTQEGYRVVNGERTDFSGFSVSTSPIASLVIALLMLAPWLAIGIKRRHDRGFTGYDVVAFTALNILLQILGIFGVGGDLVFALSLIASIWGLILFVLLGILKGEEGANSYGPNPLKADPLDP